MIESSVIPPKKPATYKEMAVMPPRKPGESPAPVTQPKDEDEKPNTEQRPDDYKYSEYSNE